MTPLGELSLALGKAEQQQGFTQGCAALQPQARTAAGNQPVVAASRDVVFDADMYYI